jgi:hypothetical protein
MAETATGRAAGRGAGTSASTARFLARLAEFVFLTDVYGWDARRAGEHLGRADKTVTRYLAYLEKHPGVREEMVREELGHDVAA